jgi:hypothetical protein
MPRHVLFFVHGIGQHAAGWAREAGGPIDTLKKSAALYDCFHGLDLENELDMVEIRYDDIFDAHLDQWAALASELKNAPGGSARFNRVNDLLARVGDDRNTFASFGGDVLLYTGFELIAKRVRLRVNAVIADKVNSAQLAARDQPGATPEFGIVGHSLGTTVVHDSLAQLADNAWLPPDAASLDALALNDQQKKRVADMLRQGAANPFAPPGFVWDCIMMVSNTSRLLCQLAMTPYQSCVKSGAGGYARNFLNVEHALDPVSKLKQFKMPGAWDGGVQIDVDHIHDPNIHGFGHYLQHPAVHGPLFRLLVPAFTAGCFDKSKELARTYPKWGEAFPPGGPRALLEQKLTQLVTDYRDSSMARLGDLLEDYTKKIGMLT